MTYVTFICSETTYTPKHHVAKGSDMCITFITGGCQTNHVGLRQATPNTSQNVNLSSNSNSGSCSSSSLRLYIP